MKLSGMLVRAATPLAAVVLVLAGILELRAGWWAAGTICLLLAMLAWVYSVRDLEKAPLTAEEIDTLRPFVVRAAPWLLITALVAVSVLHVASNLSNPRTDTLAAAAWAAAVVLGLGLTWRDRVQRKNMSAWKEKLKSNRLELAGVLLILVFAFLLRTIDLAAHPYPWSGDEASIGTEAQRILHGQVTNLFATGWSLQPMWSFVPTAIMEFFFGNNILAVRLTSAIAGTLAVLFVYLAGRELFDPTVGLLAAAFLASFAYHVHFSRIGVHNVMDSLLSSLMFWLIARGLKTGNWRYYYTAGAVAGLSIYTYAGTKLVLILGAITLLFVVIRKKGFLTSHWAHLLSFLGASMISAAPQMAFFLRHRAALMGRFGQEGILFNGWLAQQAAQTGKSALQILYTQFTRTVLVFISSPALGSFVNSPHPYLTVLGSVLFVLGMAYALACFLEPRYFILLIWFWSVIVLGGVLTLNPPANTRMLMTAPVVALLMAIGSQKALGYFQRFNLVGPRLATGVLVLLAVLIAFQNTSFYMGEYRVKGYFQDPSGEYAMEVGRMVQRLGSDYRVYIIGEPRVFASFPTLSFLAPHNRIVDLRASGLPGLSYAPPQKAAFFAIPENIPLLDQIMRTYPGGESGVVYRKFRPDEMLFQYYIVQQ